MKNALKYTAILFFGFLWFLGCSRQTVVWMADSGYLKDDFRFGDLYRLSNLSEFKEDSPKCTAPFKGKKVQTALYLAGDSFTEEGRIKPDEYATNSFYSIFVAKPNYSLKLDSGKKILLIETVERHLRERFSEKPWTLWNTPKPEIKENLSIWENLSKKLKEAEVPYHEEMHEAVLFSNDFILKLKELKADFNYHVFNRVDPKVAVLNNELVYGLDVDPGISSVYDFVSDEEIKQIVENINLSREHYRKLGFDEVYLSIIPNKSSLLLSHDCRYNRLLERVENNPNLKTPLISVWKEFSNKNYYQKGDSHWNCAGQKIWVDKVNTQLLSSQ